MTPPAHHHAHPPPDEEAVNLTPEALEHLETRMAAAVASGIRQAMTEDNAAAFWSAGIRVLQRQASEHTGRFVIGGLAAIVRKLSLFMVAGGIVYAIGGWAALAKMWQIVWSSGGTS
jgi:hypothetical protein